MTLLDKIQAALGNHYGCGQTGDAAEAVMELCARWSLQPCVASEVSASAPSGAECRHCVAIEILEEIGKAIEVYP
jgi:hypothetical protein